jgi:curved DNA-binding protein CbpA
MAKTLKDFLEGYLKVKSADEQKFIDKHVTAKNPDRNGNGDDVFKGSTKAIDRRKERKGYNPGEDEKVYEAVETERVKHPIGQRPKGPGWVLKQAGEQTGKDHNVWERKFKKVNEGYHVMRNGQSISYHQDKESADKRARTSNMRGGSNATVVKDDRSVKEELKGNQHKIDANKNGKVDAHDFKLLRKKKVAEEVEELDEISAVTKDSYAQKAGKQLPDLFKKSGKSADDARKYYNRKNTVRKIANEEVEELDEKLTAKTPMGTYIKDFQKSDAPQFKGKSASKRRVMAIAAKLTAERGGKPLNKEERLQNRINDLSEVHQRTIMHVFEKLNEDNKSKFLEACDTPEGVEQMLDFAINHRGE